MEGRTRSNGLAGGTGFCNELSASLFHCSDYFFEYVGNTPGLSRLCRPDGSTNGYDGFCDESSLLTCTPPPSLPPAPPPPSLLSLPTCDLQEKCAGGFVKALSGGATGGR